MSELRRATLKSRRPIRRSDVIPSEVEGCNAAANAFGRGQAFNPVAALTGNSSGCLDVARHDDSHHQFEI